MEFSFRTTVNDTNRSIGSRSRTNYQSQLHYQTWIDPAKGAIKQHDVAQSVNCNATM